MLSVALEEVLDEELVKKACLGRMRGRWPRQCSRTFPASSWMHGKKPPAAVGGDTRYVAILVSLTGGSAQEIHHQ